MIYAPGSVGFILSWVCLPTKPFPLALFESISWNTFQQYLLLGEEESTFTWKPWGVPFSSCVHDTFQYAEPVARGPILEGMIFGSNKYIKLIYVDRQDNAIYLLPFCRHFLKNKLYSNLLVLLRNKTKTLWHAKYVQNSINIQEIEVKANVPYNIMKI